MTDIFIEQLIKKSPTSKDLLIKIGVIALVLIIFVLFMLILPSIGLIITAAVAFGAYIIITRLNKEYEYTLTNGELDIDVIYNKASRKRLFTGNIKSFDRMAHISELGNEVVIDYSTGVPADNSYFFITNHDKKRVAIIIQPNERLLEAMAKVLTRNKFSPKK